MVYCLDLAGSSTQLGIEWLSQQTQWRSSFAKQTSAWFNWQSGIGARLGCGGANSACCFPNGILCRFDFGEEALCDERCCIAERRSIWTKGMPPIDECGVDYRRNTNLFENFQFKYFRKLNVSRKYLPSISSSSTDISLSKWFASHRPLDHFVVDRRFALRPIQPITTHTSTHELN